MAVASFHCFFRGHDRGCAHVTGPSSGRLFCPRQASTTDADTTARPCAYPVDTGQEYGRRDLNHDWTVAIVHTRAGHTDHAGRIDAHELSRQIPA